MTELSKALFIAACGFALVACSGETSSSASEQEAEGSAAESKADDGPNYCHGAEYDPSKPYHFVNFNLKIEKHEMTRLQNGIEAELAAINALPPAAQSEAVVPYLAKTQILADIAAQPLADQILPVAAALCNFESYEENECTGALSRSVRKVERIATTLAFTAPDNRGQSSRVFFSAPDYSDVTIEGPSGTSQWLRSPDGVETFSYSDQRSETRWTENPDCSGQLSKRRRGTLTEVTWTSRQAGDLMLTYKRCRNGGLHFRKANLCLTSAATGFPLIMQDNRQDTAGQRDGDRIGADEGPSRRRQSVSQPQRNAAGEHHIHGQRVKYPSFVTKQ